jgi:hypothetical protein
LTAAFHERIAELRRVTGAPQTLRGQVTVDQAYAHYQHEHLEFRHPRGGRALYLQAPLYEHYAGYLKDIAGEVLRDGGKRAMERSVEHLSDRVEAEAPIEFGDLARSGHPEVIQGGRVIYGRPPKRHRLTEAELHAKSRMTLRERWNAGLEVFFRRHGKVIRIPPGTNRRPWT